MVLNEDLLYSPSALFKLNVAPCKDRGHAIVRRGKKKHYVGEAIQSGNIYISIQGVYLFAISARLLRHQSSNQTALHLSRASVVSLRAVWSLPQFHIRTKMVMNNSPRAVSLKVDKSGRGLVGVGREGWREVCALQANTFPATDCESTPYLAAQVSCLSLPPPLRP